MGFANIDYEEKIVTLNEGSYQIDLSKLNLRSSSINAYGNEETFSIGTLKYTSTNESIVKVNDQGLVTAVKGATGVSVIKIQDIDHGYETKFTVIVNKLEDKDKIKYIYTIEDLVKFKNEVNAGDNYEGKTVYVMADIDMSSACSVETRVMGWNRMRNSI